MTVLCLLLLPTSGLQTLYTVQTLHCTEHHCTHYTEASIQWTMNTRLPGPGQEIQTWEVPSQFKSSVFLFIYFSVINFPKKNRGPPYISIQSFHEFLYFSLWYFHLSVISIENFQFKCLLKTLTNQHV